MQRKCVTYNYINKYTGYLGMDNVIFFTTLVSQVLYLAIPVSFKWSGESSVCVSSHGYILGCKFMVV